MKIERMGSMVVGMPCPLNIDGVIKYYKVQQDKTHKYCYVRILRKKIYENSLPMGEVVEI